MPQPIHKQPNPNIPPTQSNPPHITKQLLISKVSEAEFLARSQRTAATRQTLRIKACYELDRACMVELLRVRGVGWVGGGCGVLRRVVVWCGVVWCGVLWCVVWCGVVCCVVLWCGV